MSCPTVRAQCLFRNYGIAKTRLTISVTASADIGEIFAGTDQPRSARKIHPYRTSKHHPNAENEKPGRNRNVADPRMAMITRSCRAPQTTNVMMREAVGGKTRFSGEYAYLDNPYPQIGFQYCQNPEKDPAPKER
jgi:hypothetical protein